MRDIKFRGKDKANGKWIYGSLEVPLSDRAVSRHYILGRTYGQYEKHEVIPETVGQYVELKDKNGMEIYEGDMVEHEMEINGSWELYEASKVVFDEGCGIYCFEWDSPNLLSDYQNLEVVGNIYQDSKN